MYVCVCVCVCVCVFNIINNYEYILLRGREKSLIVMILLLKWKVNSVLELVLLWPVASLWHVSLYKYTVQPLADTQSVWHEPYQHLLLFLKHIFNDNITIDKNVLSVSLMFFFNVFFLLNDIIYRRSLWPNVWHSLVYTKFFFTISKKNNNSAFSKSIL